MKGSKRLTCPYCRAEFFGQSKLRLHLSACAKRLGRPT